MPFSQRASRLESLSTLYLLTSLLPGFVFAQSGSSPTDVPSSSSNGDDSGSSSFHLEPVNALIFALSIIFSLTAALQLLSAAFNIPKHAANSTLPFCKTKNIPTPFALPTPINTNPIPLYALGPIFPIALTFAALCLLVTYVLQASYWGVVFNRAYLGAIPPSFNTEIVITSWAVFSYFRDAFLSMSLFSFVCFRIRRLCYCTCRGKLHIIKRVFDMALVFTLFIMGTAFVGYRAHLIHVARSLSGNTGLNGSMFLFLSDGQLARLVQIRRANEILLVVAAVEVFISAVMLYRHAGKYLSAPDRKVAVLIGIVIGPLFLIYALYCFISQEILHLIRNRQAPSAGAICLIRYSGITGSPIDCDPSATVSLTFGRVIVTCVTLSVIIWMLLVFSGGSLVDALKGRSSTKGAPQEQFDGQVYVHTYGVTYKM